MYLWFGGGGGGGGGGAKSSPSSPSGEKKKGGLKILEGARRKLTKSKNLEREEEDSRRFSLDSVNVGGGASSLSTRSCDSPTTPYPLPSAPSPSVLSPSLPSPLPSSLIRAGADASRIVSSHSALQAQAPVKTTMIASSLGSNNNIINEEDDFEFGLGSTSGSASTSSAGSQESSLSAPPREISWHSPTTAAAEPSSGAISNTYVYGKASGTPLSPQYGNQREETTYGSRRFPSPLRMPGSNGGGSTVPRKSVALGPLENSARSPKASVLRRDEPIGTLYNGQRTADSLSAHSPRSRPISSPKPLTGAASPLHPKVGMNQDYAFPDKEFHRLPPPPVAINGPHLPASPSSAYTSVPRSPERRPDIDTKWRKGAPLGSGTFGQVFSGFHSENGQSCAIKEVLIIADNDSSVESARQLMQEVSLLSQMKHPNIVQYYGSEMLEDRLFIYLEFMSNGSIYNIIQQYGPLSESCIRVYTRQILLGLSYLHGKNTVHRDIKGANILVDKGGEVKLADFGMAKHVSEKSFLLSFKGSPYWMAPEVIQNKNGYDFAVDIWSLGCTVLEMATGKPPWNEFEGIAAVFKIGSSREVPSIPEFLSEDAKMFLRSCLQRDPLARPTAAELLEHPFVRIVEKLQPNVLSEVVRSGQKATPRSPRRGEMKLLNVMECGPESGQYSSPRHGNSDWWNGSNTARRQDGEVIQESQRARPQPLRFGNTARSNNHTQQQHIPLERSPRQQQSYALWDGSSPLPHVPVDDSLTLGEARTMRSPQRLKL